MNITDPIADMLTRIRNANRAFKAETEVPHSRLKTEIARVLKQEGYIEDFQVETTDGKKIIKIRLKIVGKERALVGLRRVSKPGLRRYVGCDDIPRVLGGMGTVILSTPRGVMTGRAAKKARVGGEILAYVW
jgi:small subunit ribosomal protein S8